MEFVLYNYFRSSASYRVRIALNLKNIPFEYRAVHLLKDGGEQFKKAYEELNPMQQVPCLVHAGQPIGQSMAIIQYLEMIQPNPRLFPLKPAEFAQVLQICEAINSGIQPLQNISVTKEIENRFHVDSAQSQAWAQFWIRKGLKSLENLVKRSAGLYCVGIDITAADCFLVPQLFTAKRFGVDIEEYQTLYKINARLVELDEFKRAEPSRQPDAASVQ